jgi:transglutaminase-like putative cysteine protease
MRIAISHLTQYRFDNPVVLNFHRIFMIPQQRSYFTLHSGMWNIDPQPMDISERLDAEGNSYYQAWFSGETSHLNISVMLNLELRNFNPFAFILDPSLPFPFTEFSYPAELLEFLAPFRKKSPSSEMDDFTNEIMARSTGIVAFLSGLLLHLHEDWLHEEREEPGILAVEKVFAEKVGSCRDLAFMMMVMLRNVGIASRFVSGYAFNQELEAGHELHAWLEAFFPGAGWIGLDPSLGLFTDQTYIPLAASYSPEFTMPVHGTYGGHASSSLHSQISIQTIG